MEDQNVLFPITGNVMCKIGCVNPLNAEAAIIQITRMQIF